jgi:transposase-like protein
MTEGKHQIIKQLLQEYNIETVADIQAALRDLLGSTIKDMMEAEMEQHLGYQKSERSDSDDYRNGYKKKTVNTSMGSLDLMYLRTGNQLLNRRLSRKDRKTYLK